MPTYQTITVDITPGAKEKPVLNASQFDNGRPFAVALTWEGVPFTDAGDFDIEIHVKKPDGNIVTAEPDSVVNEVCSFLTTEQICACHGNNECEIVLLDNDIQIGTGNFILDVEKAPDEGGIQSASEIHNLTQQIAQIVPEVLGDDYYNKTQTDALLADKADVSDLPDMSLYYTKTQTDTALNLKADKSDTYTKTEVNNALALKADLTDLPDMTNYYTKTQTDALLNDKADAADVYDKTETYSQQEVNDIILSIMPVETSGPSAVCNFNTDIATNLVNVKCTIVASGGGGTPSTPIPIVGHSAVNLTHNGTTDTIALGSTVYGGELDVTSGVLTITHGRIDLGTLTWGYIPVGASYPYGVFYTTINDKAFGAFNILCENYVTATESNFLTDKRCLGNASGTAIYITDGDYTDANAFKNSLNNVYMVYELATPQTVQLTPTQVQAIVGDNNVFCDTGDSTVQYKVSIQKYVDNQ